MPSSRRPPICYKYALSLPNLQDSPRAWLNDSQLLVFTAGGQQAAVGVEGHAEDDVSVAVDHFHRFSNLKVPDQDLKLETGLLSGEISESSCWSCGPIVYLVIIACTKQDAAGGGVPLDQTHSAAVAVKLHHRLCHVPPQTTFWDLPHPNLCSHTEVESKHSRGTPTPSLSSCCHFSKLIRLQA